MKTPFFSTDAETSTETIAEEVSLVPAAPPVILEDIDVEEVVEEAEQLLREAAPHDFEVLVLGAGPGGYVAAIRAAQLGVRVGLVEDREIGGVCLNRGCIPTKALLESVDVLRLLRRAADYGVLVGGDARPDFARMNRRKDEVVSALRENVQHLLEQNNVEIIPGRGRFVEEHTVEITSADGDTRQVLAVHVIIATGSTPQRLPVPGADLPGVVTSDELLQQQEIPEHLVVVGGGAVGVEFAYLYKELGARSTILEMSERIMPGEDEDIGGEMARILTTRGVDIRCEAKLTAIEPAEQGLRLTFETDGREESVQADCVLMATGRRANTDDLHLDEVGIEHDKGRIMVDDRRQTNVGGVYAIGDCIRNVGWAHQASAEGKMVAELALNHPSSVDLRYVPSCYYTHPETASVGLNQKDAEAEGIPTNVGKFFFRANGKAAAAGDHDGFVKVVVHAETQRILGCQIIGPRATDLINEAVLALKAGQTVEEMVGAIHAHPTFSEALPEAALAANLHIDRAD